MQLLHVRLTTVVATRGLNGRSSHQGFNFPLLKRDLGAWTIWRETRDRPSRN